eukprot:UN25544
MILDNRLQCELEYTIKVSQKNSYLTGLLKELRAELDKKENTIGKCEELIQKNKLFEQDFKSVTHFINNLALYEISSMEVEVETEDFKELVNLLKIRLEKWRSLNEEKYSDLQHDYQCMLDDYHKEKEEHEIYVNEQNESETVIQDSLKLSENFKAEIEKLTESIKELNETISSLTEENSSLAEENNTLVEEVKTLTSENNEFTKQTDEDMTKMKTMLKSNDKKMKQICDKNQKNWAQEKRKLKKQLNEAENKLELLLEENKLLEQKFTNNMQERKRDESTYQKDKELKNLKSQYKILKKKKILFKIIFNN